MTPILAKRKCGCERLRCCICTKVIGGPCNWAKRCLRHSPRVLDFALSYLYEATVCDKCARDSARKTP